MKDILNDVDKMKGLLYQIPLKEGEDEKQNKYFQLIGEYQKIISIAQNQDSKSIGNYVVKRLSGIEDNAGLTMSETYERYNQLLFQDYFKESIKNLKEYEDKNITKDDLNKIVLENLEVARKNKDAKIFNVLTQVALMEKEAKE